MLFLFCQHCNQLVEAKPLENSDDGCIGICPVCGSHLSPHRYIAPGTNINGFQVEREIGRGGMGVVYLAKQLNLDRYVALKVLSDEMASDKMFVEAFFREARAAAALNHPNIVQAFDAGAAQDYIYYFVMELIEGENLEQYTAEHGAMDFDLAFECAVKISDALTYAWDNKKLAHRDIKPENIIFKNNSEFKLADLGLAKDYRDNTTSSDDDMMATPAYASPEVIRGESDKIGFKSDMYSFGATLYQLFSGKPPFEGSDPMEVCNKQLNEQPKPLIGVNDKIPSKLSMLVDKLMEKDPDKRPASWDVVLAELKQLQDAWLHRDKIPAQSQPHAAKNHARSTGHPAKPGKKAPAKPVPQKKKSSAMPVVIVFLLLLIAGGAAAGYIFRDKFFPSKDTAQKPIPTIAPNAANTSSQKSAAVQKAPAPAPVKKLTPAQKDALEKWQKTQSGLPDDPYQAWQNIRTYLQQNSDFAPDEAKAMFRDMRKKYTDRFNELYKKISPMIEAETLTVKDDADCAQLLSESKELAKLVVCREWAKECPEGNIDLVKDFPERVEKLSSERKQAVDDKDNDFVQMCNELTGADGKEMIERIDNWVKANEKILTKTDREKEALLRRLAKVSQNPLSKVFADNKNKLRGKVILPKSLPDYMFYASTSDFLYCFKDEPESKDTKDSKNSKNGKNSRAGKDDKAKQLHKKFEWSALGQHNTLILNELIFGSSAFDSFDDVSKEILLYHAVLNQISIRKLRVKYAQCISDSDEVSRMFAGFDQLPKELCEQ